MLFKVKYVRNENALFFEFPKEKENADVAFAFPSSFSFFFFSLSLSLSSSISRWEWIFFPPVALRDFHANLQAYMFFFLYSLFLHIRSQKQFKYFPSKIPSLRLCKEEYVFILCLYLTIAVKINPFLSNTSPLISRHVHPFIWTYSFWFSMYLWKISCLYFLFFLFFIMGRKKNFFPFQMAKKDLRLQSY